MPLAYYVTKRLRGDWLLLSDGQFAAVAAALPGQRLYFTFGKKRRARATTSRRGATPVCPPGAGGKQSDP